MHPRRRTRTLLFIAIIVAACLVGWHFAPQAVRNLIEPTATAANFVVNSADDHDDGTCNVADCTLREAINAVNAGAGGDNINFNIPGGGVRTINLTSTLPALTKAATIDGTTQPGFAGVPLIELNGTNAGNSSGLTISVQNVTVRGLVINRFANFGINITANSATIQGNFIGTDPTGTNALGNTAGIRLIGATGVTIGGTTAANRNVISGNNGDGILITSSSNSNIVQGNFIGTNALGTAALGNIGSSTAGINIISSNNNTIGGTVAGAGNVISGNDGTFGVEGMKIQTSSNNTVQGNIIGLNAAATAKIGNNAGGIIILGGNSNIIGGSSTAARNVISGNGGAGILILSDMTQVKGNFLGTNGSGTAALGNGASGVLINGGKNNTIGGTNSSDRNVISGNGNGGVRIAFGADNNTVQGNYIGTDVSGTNSLSNGVGFAGVMIITSTGNTIGGTAAGAGNLIAFSQSAGVSITGNQNSVLGNSIFSNDGLGIDLDDDGQTSNDNCDADTGGNNKQNSPVITTVTPGGVNTTVAGTINATANTLHRIEVFASDSCDSSGSGEGKVFLGFADVTTNGSCTASFVVTIPNSSITGSVVTATATAGGNTSEFSSCIPLGVPISNVVQFSAATYNVTEACTAVNVTVNRSGDTSQSATVKYSTADITASDRRDYITGLGTLTFAAGETSKTIALLINDDSFVEGPESFMISLTNPTSVNLGTPSSATVQIADNAAESVTNPIDDPQTFVCQHYHDFLNRDPDSGGLAFWTSEITSCGNNAQCIEVKRINVSAAFYLSIEFQQTGFLVERIYKAAFGEVNATSTVNGAHQIRVPFVRFNNLLRDTQEIGKGVIVGQGNWEQQLDNNKNAFAATFVVSGQFPTAFPTTMTPSQFVNKLFDNAGISPTTAERNAAINEFGGAPDTTDVAARGRALRKVAENQKLVDAEFNKAFVLMQYFGYLRRNPNDPQDTDYSGYDFWLTKLNGFNNFIEAEMVKAFINSIEYRNRFAP